MGGIIVESKVQFPCRCNEEKRDLFRLDHGYHIDHWGTRD